MKNRPVAKLSDPLEKRLSMYAAVASAAGVGLLVWPQAASARVIYTKADADFPVQLDLNHDGIIDYSLDWSFDQYGGFDASVKGAPGNLVAGYRNHLSSEGWASALAPRVRIGPNRRFGSYRFMVFGYCPRRTCYGGQGPWFNVANRYLGFQFLIKGKIHYGWARVTVSVNGTPSAVLTGYAYETVPGKPLVTGKTEGPTVMDSQARTLGHLARGVSASR